MTNQERINELNTKINELENKLEHCPSLVDELEILCNLDTLYKERDGSPFLESDKNEQSYKNIQTDF